MSYSNYLRKLFPNINLEAEDLLLLEPFQIKYLPERVPLKELAVFLRANPLIYKGLILKHPPIEYFFKKTLNENKAINDKRIINKYCQELLWEIAELIVYNKYPETFEKQVEIAWETNEIMSESLFKGKVVVDVGAGTGRIAFQIAPYVKHIFAVEPVNSLRQYMRNKAKKNNIKNLFILDGFLDSIPFPDNSVDILITSNAFGWNPQDELNEIERIVKSNGSTIHLFRNFHADQENPFHEVFTSARWNYSLLEYEVDKGWKLKYFKTVKKD